MEHMSNLHTVKVSKHSKHNHLIKAQKITIVHSNDELLMLSRTKNLFLQQLLITSMGNSRHTIWLLVIAFIIFH